jgi:hypothetical protein
MSSVPTLKAMAEHQGWTFEDHSDPRLLSGHGGWVRLASPDGPKIIVSLRKNGAVRVARFAIWNERTQDWDSRTIEGGVKAIRRRIAEVRAGGWS